MQMKTKSSQWLRIPKQKILNIITSTLNRINYFVQWDRDTYTLPSGGNYRGSKQVRYCRFIKIYDVYSTFCSMDGKNVILKIVSKWVYHFGLNLYTVKSRMSKYSAQLKETGWLPQWGLSDFGFVGGAERVWKRHWIEDSGRVLWLPVSPTCFLYSVGYPLPTHTHTQTHSHSTRMDTHTHTHTHTHRQTQLHRKCLLSLHFQNPFWGSNADTDTFNFQVSEWNGHISNMDHPASSALTVNHTKVQYYSNIRWRWFAWKWVLHV